MKNRLSFFSILAFQLFSFSALATPVYFNPSNFVAGGELRKITVSPAQPQWIYQGQWYSGAPISFYPPATNNLVPGDYYVTIAGISKNWKLPVPDTTNLVDAAAVSTTLPSYVIDMKGLTNAAIDTNVLAQIMAGLSSTNTATLAQLTALSTLIGATNAAMSNTLVALIQSATNNLIRQGGTFTNSNFKGTFTYVDNGKTLITVNPQYSIPTFAWGLDSAYGIFEGNVQSQTLTVGGDASIGGNLTVAGTNNLIFTNNVADGNLLTSDANGLVSLRPPAYVAALVTLAQNISSNYSTLVASTNISQNTVAGLASPVSRNLFNPTNATDGVYRNYGSVAGVNPGFGTNAQFAVTGYLPVKPGNSYILWYTNTETFFGEAYCGCYDKNTNYIGMSTFVSPSYNIAPGVTGGYQSGGANPGRKWTWITLSPSSGVYFIQNNLIANYAHSSADFARLMTEVQFETTTNATPYQPYSIASWQLGQSSMPDSYSGILTNVAWGNSLMRVFKAGNDVWIRTPWGTNTDFAQRLTLGIFNTPLDNNQVEMWSYGTVPTSAADTNIVTSTTSLKSIQDDICPTKFYGNWMGANHGWNVVISAGVSSHDKTAPDVGSEWLDGSSVKWYLIAIPSATNLWFLSAGTNVSDFTTTMTGNLSHSSGATHTAGITITSKTISQLYPSVKNQTKRMLLNGLADLTWDGTYNAQFLDVQHSYDIENLGSILAYVRANVGSATAPALDAAAIATDARVTTTYHFTPNAAVTVYRTFKSYTNVTLNYDGVIQSGSVIIPSSGKLWQYIPKTTAFTTVSNQYNTGTTHTYSFTNLTDITSYNDEIWLGKTGWAATNSPPDRFIQIVTDSGGNKTFGFACGFNTRMGLAQTNLRSGLITNAFYLYPGQKMYPFGVDSSAYPTNMPPNTTLDLVAFRCPLNFTSYTNATAVSWYYVGQDCYWMVDFHTNISDYVPCATDLVGRSIEIVEADPNTTILSKFVTTDGIKLTVTNNYGYAVLKLSPQAPSPSPALTTSGVLALIAGYTNAEAVQIDGGGSTPSSGIKLTNGAAATSGQQQYSPILEFDGQAWSTTGSATAPIAARIGLQTASSTVGSGTIAITLSVSNAAAITLMTLTTSGTTIAMPLTTVTTTPVADATSSVGSTSKRYLDGFFSRGLIASNFYSLQTNQPAHSSDPGTNGQIIVTTAGWFFYSTNSGAGRWYSNGVNQATF